MEHIDNNHFICLEIPFGNLDFLSRTNINDGNFPFRLTKLVLYIPTESYQTLRSECMLNHNSIVRLLLCIEYN